MALPEKFIRSKCPNCKKNGIEFWKTRPRYNPKLTCKYCKKTYKVSWIVSFVFTMIWACVMGILLSLISKHVFRIHEWLGYVMAFIPYLIFEYFAPLKEVDNTKDINTTEEINDTGDKTGDDFVS